MYILTLIILFLYFTTGIIKNILYIIDYCNKQTEKHNEELRQRLKKLG